MDVFSHVLLSFILGQTLQLDRNLQLILIVSSVSLDIDAISIRSQEAAFRSHRGPLHSILAALLASVLISSGCIFFMGLPPTALLSVIPVCLAGLFSHLFLDLLTIGNMKVLWPFSKRNFAFSLAHFIDPTFLGALLIAALLIIYTKTAGGIQIVAVATVAYLALSFGVRYYERKVAIKIIKGLDGGVASETVLLPTLRPNKWWAIEKIPFESGYNYEIGQVDCIRNKILSKSNVESPYLNFNGPAGPPIDSPQKAVACSKRDKRTSAFIAKFLLPAVSVTPLDHGRTWEVLWYDIIDYTNKREPRGILVRVRVDGTVAT